MNLEQSPPASDCRVESDYHDDFHDESDVETLSDYHESAWNDCEESGCVDESVKYECGFQNENELDHAIVCDSSSLNDAECRSENEIHVWNLTEL